MNCFSVIYISTTCNCTPSNLVFEFDSHCQAIPQSVCLEGPTTSLAATSFVCWGRKKGRTPTERRPIWCTDRYSQMPASTQPHTQTIIFKCTHSAHTHKDTSTAAHIPTQKLICTWDLNTQWFSDAAEGLCSFGVFGRTLCNLMERAVGVWPSDNAPARMLCYMTTLF